MDYVRRWQTGRLSEGHVEHPLPVLLAVRLNVVKYANRGRRIEACIGMGQVEPIVGPILVLRIQRGRLGNAGLRDVDAGEPANTPGKEGVRVCDATADVDHLAACGR